MKDKNINSDFINWLNKKSKLYFRFNELSNLFENFINEYVFTSQVAAETISERFYDMLGKCNLPNIYDKESAVQTYSMLHFLDRYRRYQLIYLVVPEKRRLVF